MTIGAIPERGALADDRDGQLMATPAWMEFFRGIFYALFGWKRSFTNSATLDFGNILAGTEASLTVAVTGARVGDAVIVTPASKYGGIIDNFGIVTANDVVTVYAHNYTGGPIDPPSKSYRVVVLQQ